MNGRFEISAIAVFVAMVLDAGRPRRAAHPHAERIRRQYDSLSDMVSFARRLR